MEDIITTMNAPSLEKLHHLENIQAKQKKKLVQQAQDERFIFSGEGDYIVENKAKINKELKRK